MEEFYHVLNHDPNSCAYGIKDCQSSCAMVRPFFILSLYCVCTALEYFSELEYFSVLVV